jgi:hypothetical protein
LILNNYDFAAALGRPACAVDASREKVGPNACTIAVGVASPVRADNNATVFAGSTVDTRYRSLPSLLDSWRRYALERRRVTFPHNLDRWMHAYMT